jgi:hypothetical protein
MEEKNTRTYEKIVPGRNKKGNLTNMKINH